MTDKKKPTPPTKINESNSGSFQNGVRPSKGTVIGYAIDSGVGRRSSTTVMQTQKIPPKPKK
jgi:hypothetical protein